MLHLAADGLKASHGQQRYDAACLQRHCLQAGNGGLHHKPLQAEVLAC
jgi:hypothetical protein